MTVNHLWTLSDSYEVTGLGYASEGQIEQEGQPVSLKENELLNRLIRTNNRSCSQRLNRRQLLNQSMVLSHALNGHG